MKEDADYIYEQAKKHTEWFSKSLPMIASENIISPMARDLMLSELQDKYAEGAPGDRYYEGNIYVDNIELKVQELARDLFGVDYADVRPISGTNANQAVLMALGGPDKTITSVDVSDGAHISSAVFGSVGLRGMKPKTYPFDVDEMNIDVEGTKKLIKEEKPDIALFGRSVFMFPPPLEELQEVFEEVGVPRLVRRCTCSRFDSRRRISTANGKWCRSYDWKYAQDFTRASERYNTLKSKR